MQNLQSSSVQTILLSINSPSNTMIIHLLLPTMVDTLLPDREREVLIQSSSGNLLRLRTSNRSDVRENERLRRFRELSSFRLGIVSGGGRGEGVGEDVEDVIDASENEGILLLNESAKSVELSQRTMSIGLSSRGREREKLTVFSLSAKSRLRGRAPRKTGMTWSK